MSFMMHPYPYADPNAVNDIDVPESVRESLCQGLIPVAQKLARLVREGNTLGIDAYPGADFEPLIRVLRQQLAGEDVAFRDAASLLLPAETITDMLRPYLPEDRDADPVLLYGRRYREGYRGLQDPAKVASLREQMATSGRRTVVYGRGAVSEALQDAYDVRVWIDVTPRTAVLNFKQGKAVNIGMSEALPYSLMMRRNYYVDFETAMEQRWQLIRQGQLDYYITADDPSAMQMLPFGALRDLFEELNRRPFRCRPVYLEGVWGGYYVHRLRHLPKEMRNCAWVFDMIPLEVSLVAKLDEGEWEVPFFTFVQTMGAALLGARAYDAFGGYFPIRFNYDDTFHSAGNMSVQCHPDAEYVIGNHGEFGRQDESYYIVATGQGAKTYLGFETGDSCEAFLALADKAQHTHETVDYQAYIHAVPSVPGTQVMIPAGTVHASGRNQVILEIGSLTVGSYTYKMYDYQRIDPQTGLPRPIHLKMARDVIRPERDAAYVQENLVNHGGVLREGDGYREIIVGEHDLLYFSLRNLVFDKEIEDETNGDFHVLALVDGERVRVESRRDPSLFYELNPLDIVVVPASFGAYRLVNRGVGTVTVHKTLLKR